MNINAYIDVYMYIYISRNGQGRLCHSSIEDALREMGFRFISN